MNNDFCYLLRVRYSEYDAQKVVFNGRYTEYVDIAVNEFTRVIWDDYNSLLEAGIDNQVVNLNMSWKAPAHFDEVIAITVKPIKVGNTSYTLQVDFYNHESSKVLVSAEIVYVMISTDRHEKMQVSKEMRKQFEEGAKGIIIDHAGL